MRACDRCSAPTDDLGVCTSCGRHTRLDARERIRLLTRSFEERDARLAGGDPLHFAGYAQAVRDAREAAGTSESVVWGMADVHGVRCALVVCEFAFLGGSMGVAAGEKVARAFDAARSERLPVLAVTASGGARMQEGMVALVQMAKTAEARRRHTRAGLGALTLLTSPTTGGVYASYASLGDLVIAEPGATVGFAGPRVVEELTGTRPEADVHTAEYAHAHGTIDAIVARSELNAVLASGLRALAGTPGRPTALRPKVLPKATGAGPGAWDRLQLARHPDRPKATALLEALLADAVELGPHDAGVVVRFGALRPSGVRVAVVAQDASGEGRILTDGFRLAVRAFETAGRLGLPVVVLVDTRGADPLPASEADGVAAAIARTFVAALDCPTPTLAVVTGEGGSGGALSMAACDRVVAWEHAVFSVIAPEGAASILYRDGSRAPELAERLRITAPDLVELGLADGLVPEPAGGAHTDPPAAAAGLAAAVAQHLDEIIATPNPARLAHRRRRWRRAGNRWLRPGRGS